MNVKNILINTAKLLNMNDVLDYLADTTNVTPSADTVKDVNDMILAVNITNSNIACNYIELTDKYSYANPTGNIPFRLISTKNILEIKSVRDRNGHDVKYSLRADSVILDPGYVEIEYSYYPASVGINDTIGYYLKLNEIIFAMGVAGEYLFIKGAIDDAYMWDKRFKQMMFSAMRPKRKINMQKK